MSARGQAALSSYLAGEMENCVIKYGCLVSYDPHVGINNMKGDATAKFDIGEGGSTMCAFLIVLAVLAALLTLGKSGGVTGFELTLLALITILAVLLLRIRRKRVSA